ncbi:phage portal protein [Roseivivax sp. THAF30]|uniref:phage portal protein n=1 Tax=Roseivivax sp. THAF30 TaxID=2587852 RepID=UPI001268E10E|nr:phage portal protein [Roseivivax sp. THAF30]QFT63852.1 Phage portal protein, lambda family [Roseivivax sp. THAF30]
MSLLSRLNPFKREAASVAVRSLDAATGSPRRASGMGQMGPINLEVGAGGEITARRANYLASNNPWCANGVSNWVTALVGTGIRPTPVSEDADENARVAASFEAWADEADHAGRTDLWGLQRGIVRHLVVDGEALVLLRDEADGLRLQVVPPAHLDRAKSVRLSDGREIYQGVEMDADGRRLAYWILPDRPSGDFAAYTPSVRVDAADVMHVFQPDAAGQVRGLSWLAPAVLTASELDQLTDAQLVSAKVSALFAGFVTDTTNMGGAGEAFPDSGGDISLEPGTVRVLPGGTDIRFTSPEAMKDAPAFTRQYLLALSAALGLPEHLVSGDVSNANYSSLRAALVTFRQRVEQVQYATLAPQLLRPIWRRWLVGEVVAGRLDVPADLRAEWIMPRQPWVDPAKDLEAVETALRLGLTSRSQAVNELGWDAAALDREIATDRAREADLGLSFSTKGAASDQ